MSRTETPRASISIASSIKRLRVALQMTKVAKGEVNPDALAA
jgi:hypothetical protein